MVDDLQQDALNKIEILRKDHHWMGPIFSTDALIQLLHAVYSGTPDRSTAPAFEPNHDQLPSIADRGGQSIVGGFDQSHESATVEEPAESSSMSHHQDPLRTPAT